MTDFWTRLMSRRSVKLLMTAMAALFAVASVTAWLLHHEEASLLAASLAIVIPGLMAIVVRIGFGRRNEHPLAQIQRRAETVGDRIPHLPSIALASAADEGSPAPLNFRRWSLDVFAAIDAQRFAAVCETWFSWAGFDTRSEAHRTNEGVDIWLHAARMPGPVAIVRCKHWINKPVGLQEMKEFLGVVDTFQSAHGTYTTTSTYTPEALQFAREHGIDAVDGRGLLRRIQTRTRQRQQALLAVAYNGQS